LVNIAISPSFAGCWCGASPGLFLFWTASQSQRGCCRHPLCMFGIKIVDLGNVSDVLSVWGLPMLTEFQLWVLSTILMLGLVIVSVKLPG